MRRRFRRSVVLQVHEGSMNPTVSLIIAVIIGAVVAAVFGILIGIPVLRLKGDYLAIVTLAFGEIIKNIINAVYLGRDGSGFHISLKDSMSLNMDADGEVLIKVPRVLPVHLRQQLLPLV